MKKKPQFTLAEIRKVVDDLEFNGQFQKRDFDALMAYDLDDAAREYLTNRAAATSATRGKGWPGPKKARRK